MKWQTAQHPQYKCRIYVAPWELFTHNGATSMCTSSHAFRCCNIVKHISSGVIRGLLEEIEWHFDKNRFSSPMQVRVEFVGALKNLGSDIFQKVFTHDTQAQLLASWCLDARGHKPLHAVDIFGGYFKQCHVCLEYCSTVFCCDSCNRKATCCFVRIMPSHVCAAKHVLTIMIERPVAY